MLSKWTIGAKRAQFGWFFLMQLILLASPVFAFAQSATPAHPLDPLTAGELMIVQDVLAKSGKFSPSTNFVWIELAEPLKAVVENFKPGAEFARQARIAAVDFEKMRTFEVVVDIRAAGIISIRDLGQLQPGITDPDIAIAKSVVDSDAGIRQALVNRGMNISGKVSDATHVLYYSIGHDRSLDAIHHRLMRVIFASDQNAVNAGSPLVGGVMAVIDLYSRQVIKLYDFPGVPSKTVPHDIFDPNILGTLNKASTPAVPKSDWAPTIADNVITWRNWRFRYGFNLREGLVLYQISFNDSGNWRSIVYRASVSEVVTTYADPDRLWSWMEVFDEGGGGLGLSSLPVQPSHEVPANADVLDVLLPEPGLPRSSSTLANRIYVYERDGGNLMYYWQDGRTVQVRSTELVVGFLAALGNYDYAFNWIFKEDGSFTFAVELAGEVLTKFVRAQRCQVCELADSKARGGSRTIESHGDDRYGTLVYPNVVAVNHQHWFNVRLNFDIDGTDNAAMENNIRWLDRHRAASRADGQPPFVQTHTVFARAADAKRDVNDEVSRTWTIYNPRSLNRLGRPAGYTIVPGENTSTQFPASRKKGTMGFTFHHFWVTPLRERELYAAGSYPDEAKKDYSDTLYSYANNESIYNKDIVVWYSLGMTHVPRPEDYPIMSEAKLSVTFVPDGFFSRNGALGRGPSLNPR